jgi:RHS repeat-associated protein
LDLARNLTQVVYPTGRTVNYTYDAANRSKTAVDASNGITYATDFQTAPAGCLSGAVCYTPQGTFYALSIGQTSSFTGLNLTHTYNNRLQPNEFKASSSGGNAIDISYNFIDPVTSHNAGHVYGITNNLDTTRSQTFTYDSLSRITGALTTSTYATSPAHCWGESYTLDAWGNLNSIAGTTNSNYTGCAQESGFSTTADGNNHLPIFGYDASGNTSSDGVVTNYQWDAESQLKSAAGVSYTYDGDGRRVSKVGSKLYWYGSGGEILAETDTSGNTTAEYIFFGGKRIAMLPAGSSAQFYVEDLLGTSRVITTNSGVVCYDADFYPFGGERAYTNTCPQNYKFEGKERDTETGNDDFGARYYSNRFGRWLSADWSAVSAPIPYANLTNPQTLNLYSMVADDPESFADLDGHCGHTTMPGAASATERCGNNYTAGLQGEGFVGFDENSGIPDWYSGEVSAASAQYTAQQQAAQNANQQAQNQSGLTVSVVSGQKDAAGTPYAEAAAGFTVSIQSKTNFAPGDLTVTGDLHFDADKKVAKGTEVLLGAAAESAQAKVGGQEAPKTVNSLLVDVRPYNKSGSFGGKPQEGGYIRFTTTDSQGHKQTGTLNVQVISKRIPGGYSLPAGAWVQRLVVPIPNP